MEIRRISGLDNTEHANDASQYLITVAVEESDTASAADQDHTAEGEGSELNESSSLYDGLQKIQAKLDAFAAQYTPTKEKGNNTKKSRRSKGKENMSTGGKTGQEGPTSKGKVITDHRLEYVRDVDDYTHKTETFANTLSICFDNENTINSNDNIDNVLSVKSGNRKWKNPFQKQTRSKSRSASKSKMKSKSKVKPMSNVKVRSGKVKNRRKAKSENSRAQNTASTHDKIEEDEGLLSLDMFVSMNRNPAQNTDNANSNDNDEVINASPEIQERNSPAKEVRTINNDKRGAPEPTSTKSTLNSKLKSRSKSRSRSKPKFTPKPRRPFPRHVCCYSCGQEFTTYSLPFHLRQCLTKRKVFMKVRFIPSTGIDALILCGCMHGQTRF